MTESSALSERQEARAAALRVAREVLASRALASSGAVDPRDLYCIALYIETGRDPWAVAHLQSQAAA